MPCSKLISVPVLIQNFFLEQINERPLIFIFWGAKKGKTEHIKIWIQS